MLRRRLMPMSVSLVLLMTTAAQGAQVDITGTVGSVAFGNLVKALPNGNHGVLVHF